MRIDINHLQALIIEAFKNAYQVLGVQPGASDEDIKKAWKAMAIKHHPDKGGAQGEMVDINNAKVRLLDKTALFRFGANIQGYEDPNAPKPVSAQSPPPAASGSTQGRSVMIKCKWCQREVKAVMKDMSGSFVRVNHYTRQGGSEQCPGSSKASWNGPPTGWRAHDPQAAVPPQPPPPPREAPPPPPGPRPPPNAGPERWYYTYMHDGSSKFWEAEVVDNVVHVRWGRIGSEGQTQTKTFPSRWRAMEVAHRMRQNKQRKGYARQTTVPPGVPRPSQAPAPGTPPGAAPGPRPHQPRPEPTGRPRTSQDTYKVYPWRQSRRVVRVGGKLYGTGTGGSLSGGGQTRFNANDRLKVSPDDGKMKVGKADSDYTQSWDPIDEVRQVVEELVLETIVRIAEG